MNRIWRILRITLISLVALLALAAALLAYFVYTPDPEPPPLTGTLTKSSMPFGGTTRVYRTYIPKGLPQGAALVVVMHGSGEAGPAIRVGTGYGFERLADRYGFAVAYPNSLSFDWNDCGRVGDYAADGREVDDVGFLLALTDKLIAENGIARERVFATGVSSGGFMALRLALEAPARFRAVAAVAANVQTADNFKCKPAVPLAPGTSVMIMNGTKDPLVPFEGGEVNLLGLFYKCGTVRSSRDSAQYFADLNHLAGPPETKQAPVADGVGVERVLWRGDTKTEVELVAVHGGGHGMPQPYYRRPRLLGPSPMAPDGPALIWEFFARQR